MGVEDHPHYCAKHGFTNVITAKGIGHIPRDMCPFCRAEKAEEKLAEFEDLGAQADLRAQVKMLEDQLEVQRAATQEAEKENGHLVGVVAELAGRVAELEWEHEFGTRTQQNVLAEYGVADPCPDRTSSDCVADRISERSVADAIGRKEAERDRDAARLEICNGQALVWAEIEERGWGYLYSGKV